MTVIIVVYFELEEYKVESTKSKTMKTCSSCGTEIAKSAKTCPKCGAKNKKPIYKRVWFIALVLVVGIGAISSMGGNTDDGKTPAPSTSGTAPVAETPMEIVYTSYDVSTLVDDLGVNAMKAEENYNDAYVTLTGKLGTIDSDGKYIALDPANSAYSFTNVQCYIKNDEQKTKVMEMSAGDTVVLSGQITRVGELLGYSLDIDSIQ